MAPTRVERLALAVSVVVTLSVAARSRAQDTPPDVVFEPLVAQAESERAARPELAHAHADAALRFAPNGSALATRARVVLGATHASSAPVADDTIWEPLVVAAENDAAAGRRPLALDRLSAALRALPPNGALATRARNLYTTLSAATPSAPPPAPMGQPLAPTYGQPYPPAYGQTAPPSGQPYGQPYAPYGQPYPPTYGQPYPPPGAPGYALVPPRPADPTLRSGAELVLFSVVAGSYGAFAGGWLLDAAGVSPDRNPGWYYVMPVLTTAALLAGVYGLDQVGGGMRAGQPTALMDGMLLGFGIGLLTVGYASFPPCAEGPLGTGCSRPSATDSLTNISIVGGATAIGLGVGAVYAYGVKPRPAAATLTLSASLWGLYFGGMFALMDHGSLDTQTEWVPLIVGTAAGAVTGALLGEAIHPSGARVGLLWAGFAAGALVGALVPLGFAGSTFDDGWAGLGLALGATVGLGVVALLTGDMRDDLTRPAAPPPVMMGLAPLPGGGATVTLSGTM